MAVARDLISLIHVVGFSVGVALYGMLAVMTARASRSAERWSPAAGRIPVLAAILGLAWNASALVDVTWHLSGIGDPNPWILTVGYAALGFLPAVVVDSATRIPGNPRLTLVAIAAYALSAAAAVLQAVGTQNQRGLSNAGLLTLTLGYAAVIVMLAVISRRPDAQRNVTTAALAAFALSALHLSSHSPTPESLVVAILGHHASLPLVLVILYQDYRFALADLFLKRALSVLALVGIAMGTYAIVVVPLSGGDMSRAPAAAPGLLLAAWVGTALAYPIVAQRMARLVDRFILKRPDYRAVGTSISHDLRLADTVEHALDGACVGLCGALTATRVWWSPAEQTPPPEPVVTLEGTSHAEIVVPTSDSPAFRIRVEGLAAGRRLLSDDVTLLETTAMLTARRIDELRMTAERRDRDVREAEMRRLTIEAELRALRAQLNPHFLFNALTTIDFLIKTSPARATATLHELTALLRSVLRRGASEFVTLADELHIVDAYLAIEQARFEERLGIERAVDPDAASLPIPPLLVQPLVENAVKHGIAPLRTGGTIRIEARVDRSLSPARLILRVIDTGLGFSWQAERGGRARLGVGLGNVSERIRRYYGTAGEVVITRVADRTVVELRLPVSAVPAERTA